MEGLLGILVGIVFLISTFSNVAKKFMQDQDSSGSKEIDGKIDELFPENSRKTEEPPLSKQIGRLESQREIQSTKIERPMADKVVKQSADRRDSLRLQKKAVRLSNAKGEKKNNISGEEENLLRLEEKDLIRGVIFKEILDSPRAKRPYLPPNYRN